MAATGEGTPAHFVKVEEDKSQRKGRSRLIRYFLVDSEGNRTLAAVGEEAAQGDAHYKYYNHPSFDAHGELTCHNRKDLNAWLDRVIADSRVAAGLPPTDGSEAVNVNLPADAPPWVDSRQERFTQEGKRGARYYLIDASGRETLAASGTERGSGQYAFNSTPYFDAFYPLKAGNMSTTQRWLGDVVAASMAVHGRADGVGAGAHRKAQPGAKRGSEPRLGGAAEASHLKRLRMMQMEQDSKARSGQNLALEVLREECGRERLRRMLLRHTAAVMLQDEDAATPAVTNEALAGHVEVLDRYADQLEGGGGGRGGAAVDERAAAVALHAVASRQLTFRTVSQFDLVPLLRRLARAWAPPHEACTAAPAVLFPGCGNAADDGPPATRGRAGARRARRGRDAAGRDRSSSPDGGRAAWPDAEAVPALAAALLDRIRGACAQTGLVLADPRLIEDPVQLLDAALAQRPDLLHLQLHRSDPTRAVRDAFPHGYRPLSAAPPRDGVLPSLRAAAQEGGGGVHTAAAAAPAPHLEDAGAVYEMLRDARDRLKVQSARGEVGELARDTMSRAEAALQRSGTIAGLSATRRKQTLNRCKELVRECDAFCASGAHISSENRMMKQRAMEAVEEMMNVVQPPG